MVPAMPDLQIQVSDEDENAPPWSFTVQHTDTQESVERLSHPCLVSAVPQTPNNQVHTTNNSAWWLSGWFPWDKIVNGNSSHDLSTLQKVNEDIKTLVLHDIIAALVSLSVYSLSDSWHPNYQDPLLWQVLCQIQFL